MNESTFNINNLKLNLCPACGAPLDFDEEHGMIHCNYCNNSFTAPENHSAENIIFSRNAQFQEFVSYVKSGDKVKAIQLYMHLTNSSLSIANKVFEKLSLHYNIPLTDANQIINKKSLGILTLIIISVIMIAFFSLMLFFLIK